MQRRFSIFLSVLLLCSFVFVPVMAGARTASAPRQPAAPERPARVPPSHLQKVPEEIVAAFEGGMSVKEFVARSGGRVPKALESVVDREVTVVVELEMAPLA